MEKIEDENVISNKKSTLVFYIFIGAILIINFLSLLYGVIQTREIKLFNIIQFIYINGMGIGFLALLKLSFEMKTLKEKMLDENDERVKKNKKEIKAVANTIIIIFMTMSLIILGALAVNKVEDIFSRIQYTFLADEVVKESSVEDDMQAIDDYNQDYFQENEDITRQEMSDGTVVYYSHFDDDNELEQGNVENTMEDVKTNNEPKVFSTLNISNLSGWYIGSFWYIGVLLLVLGGVLLLVINRKNLPYKTGKIILIITGITLVGIVGLITIFNGLYLSGYSQWNFITRITMFLNVSNIVFMLKTVLLMSSIYYIVNNKNTGNVLLVVTSLIWIINTMIYFIILNNYKILKMFLLPNIVNVNDVYNVNGAYIVGFLILGLIVYEKHVKMSKILNLDKSNLE